MRSSFSCVLTLLFFFFNDTATTEIYTLSLHDALPISTGLTLLGTVLLLVRLIGLYVGQLENAGLLGLVGFMATFVGNVDRKSTRLNSSHANISYAVFCLKKKKKTAEIKIHQHGIDMII